MLNDLTTELLQTRGQGMTLPSDAYDLSLEQSYEVAHQLYRKQREQGKTLAGRKIGISNRAAWNSLGLDDVVWGYVFGESVVWAENNHAALPLAGMSAPKLEPEIVFGLKDSLPTGTRDPAELLQAVEWLALGFEVVQNPYPDWRFKPADLVATFGFHGALVVGSKVKLEGQSLSRLAATLAETQVSLYKDGEVIEDGGGKNVVDSPAAALGHLADLIVGDAKAEALGTNELVTTGTLTAAPSIAAGESYRVTVTGLELPDLTLELT